MSLKIEVESPRRDLVVVNYFHKLALIKGESVTVESTLWSQGASSAVDGPEGWVSGDLHQATCRCQFSGTQDSIAGSPWHDTQQQVSPLKSPSPSAWITKRKLLQSNLSTGAESSDSFCSSSFVSSQLLPLNKLISSYTFLLAWVKVFDHEIFQFYEE